VLAYAAIALEHPLRINKSASALLGAGLLWTIYALASGDSKLVAASMDMYSLTQYPPNSFLWEFMAYCAGTGDSILIIGLVLLGYGAGALVYIAQFHLLH
jgi:hypothetical protein